MLTFILTAVATASVTWMLDRWRRSLKAKKTRMHASANEDATNEEGEWDYGPLEALLKDLAAPAIRFEPQPVREEEMALGRTRIGGQPDLPSQRSWPLTRSGKPMSFLAQFDLGKMNEVMPNSPLPSSGSLSFFALLEDELPADGALESAVLFTPPTDDLKRKKFPSALAEDDRFGSCSLGGGLVRTYPEQRHEEVTARMEVDEDMLSDFWSDMNMGTHLLGYVNMIQGPPEYEAELAFRFRTTGRVSLRSEEEAKAIEGWCLLFQLDSEEEAGMMWGDAGYLYFMIRKDDLQHHRFENVVCIFQCH